MIKVKVNVKLFLLLTKHNGMVYWESGGIVPLSQYGFTAWCLSKRYSYTTWCFVRHRDFTFIFIISDDY
jgi:hypothetical protein